MTELQAISSGGDIQAVIDASLAAAAPNRLDEEGRFHTVVVPQGGTLQVIDIEEHLEKFRDAPRRKTGTVVVHDAISFNAYIAKHGLPESELFADQESRSLTAVINAHGGTFGRDSESIDTQEQSKIAELAPVGTVIEDTAGFCDHRVHLRLVLSPEWIAWNAKHRRDLTQLDFAEHVEDHLVNVVEPPSAEMLEIAQTLSVKRGVHFESSNQLRSGERNLIYREDDDAKAGRKGDLSIPEKFQLALRPFEGGPTYAVTARLRYRINDGRLTLKYVLDRPDEVLRNAFLDIRTEIEQNTGRTVFAGSPNGAR